MNIAVEDLAEDDQVVVGRRVLLVSRVAVRGDRVHVGLCSLPFDGRGPAGAIFQRGTLLQIVRRADRS